MLQGDRGWYLMFAVIGTFTVLTLFQWDVQLIIRWGILGMLTLAVATFSLNTLGPRVSSWWNQAFPKHQQKEERGLPEDELTTQRRDRAERIQEEYQQKASKYQEEVLLPREQAKREQLEKEFYNFAGPAWKGKANRLGETDDGTQIQRRQRPKGSSKDAVSVRKLPESATRSPPPQPEQKQRTKRIITLPDEPPEGTPESVTVAMRGITGKVNKRRFISTTEVQILIDWMTKQGYHPQIYTLCTTYPRRDLYPLALQTMEEIGIIRDVLLIVEERVERLTDEEFQLQESKLMT